MNFIDVTLKEGNGTQAVVELPGGITATVSVDASRATPGSKATLGIRPEDAGGDAGDFVLPITVDVAERLGGSTFLYGACGGMKHFVVQRPGMEATGHGDSIELNIPSKSCYLFDADGMAYHRPKGS
jgi:ABC-type sugar transport system ATPase subunit